MQIGVFNTRVEINDHGNAPGLLQYLMHVINVNVGKC